MESSKRLLIAGPINSTKISGPLESITLLSRYLSKLYLVKTKTFDNLAFEYNGVLVEPLRWRDIASSDIVIFTGIYNVNFLRWSMICLIFGKELVVSPRGNLTTASLLKSKIKKKIYLEIVRLILRNNCRVHFLSEREKKCSTQLLGRNTFIAHNFRNKENVDNSFALAGDDMRANVIVFIGRYDIYHKGLDLLLQFLKIHEKTLVERSIKVELYGPSRDDGAVVINKIIRSLNLDTFVSVNTSINHELIPSKLRKSKYFIHFSRYEGVPQSVLDAFEYGCKLLVTYACNLTDDIYESEFVYVLDEERELKYFLDQPVSQCYERNSQMLDNDLILKQYASIIN